MEIVYINKEDKFFGTDMASFGNEQGETVITSGGLYAITEGQYCKAEGDITYSEAIRIANVRSK